MEINIRQSGNAGRRFSARCDRLMKLITLILASLLTGCITAPDLETGDGCWRYGVADQNTGRMTRYADVNDIPVTTLGMDDLMQACGVDIQVWGCYQPIQDEIFVYWGGGKRTLYEEICHSIKGVKHNNCDGYGISDCDWVIPPINS
ncbi:MAG: hypothetical protein ACI9CB_002586 [Rhodothermales bacterium]|jgi:hypothetical protein